MEKLVTFFAKTNVSGDRSLELSTVSSLPCASYYFSSSPLRNKGAGINVSPVWYGLASPEKEERGLGLSLAYMQPARMCPIKVRNYAD